MHANISNVFNNICLVQTGPIHCSEKFPKKKDNLKNCPPPKKQEAMYRKAPIAEQMSSGHLQERDMAGQHRTTQDHSTGP